MTPRWPLTEAQEGIWYAQALNPASPVFNTGQFVEIRGPLDVAAFQAAVNRMIAETEAFRLRFDGEGAVPGQWLDPAPAEGLILRDHRALAHAAAEAEARAEMDRDQATPVDLAAGGVARFVLHLVGPDKALWYERAHHLALDGYAMVMVTQRVAALYNEAVGGRPAPLSPAPFVKALEADAAYRDDPRRSSDAAFWRDRGLQAGAPDAPGRGRTTSAGRFDRFRMALDADLRAMLMARADALKLPWPDILAALTGAYLARYAPEGPAVIGVPFMNRAGSVAARVPCATVNVLPLAVAPDEDVSVGAFLAAVAADLAGARRHGRYRSEQLRRDLGLVGGARRLHGPLVNVLPFDATPRFLGCASRLEILGAGSVDDLTFTFRGDPRAALDLEVDSNPDRHDPAEAAAHGRRLAAFLAAALAAERLAAVPLASPEEARWLDEVNATDHPVPGETLTALIEAAMTAAPEAPAMRHDGMTIRNRALDRRTLGLARALAARGVGIGDIVAIDLPRSPDLVVALFGILRAGASWLPLNPEDPPARKRQVLDLARPRAVLGHGEGELHPADWDGPATALPKAAATDPAYVLFTSGSTGAPKGVVVSHRAIVNRLIWMREHYGFGPADRILQKTPATFDVSIWEFFLPVLSGATMILAPDGAHRDPRHIARLIGEERVTTAHFVPSMLEPFLQTREAQELVLKRLFTSGEALGAGLRDRTRRVLRTAIHNLYGPTEAAVDVSFWEAGPDDRSDPVPIGRPVWNTQLHVLDERMRPLPPGAPGRLWIGGVQVAEGYLGRPDLTAERFLPDPVRPGGRLYDTGDLAVRRADRAILYLGRGDSQVKINGIRIEPGEIEARLMAAAPVAQVAVAPVTAASGAVRLVAWVVPQPGAAVTRKDMAALAAELLPAPMRPSDYVVLDALPLTASGKLDRKALPEPIACAVPVTEETDEATQRIACAFAEVLGLGHVAPDADFFALGGDSLSAVRLIIQLEQDLGRDPGLAALFDAPTPRALAQVMARQAEVSEGARPLLRLSEGQGAPLWCLPPAGGLGWCYRDLARALPGRPVLALQAPTLDPEAPLARTLMDLAAQYATRIEEAQPAGPLHLIGWSVGGILAHALAARLISAGRVVASLALVDAYPSQNWRDAPDPGEAAALKAVLAIAGHDPDAHPDLRTPEAVLGFLRGHGHPLGHLSEHLARGVIRTVQATNRLVRTHREPVLPIPLIHFTAALDHAGTARSPEQWRAFAAVVESVPLPLKHGEMVGPEASRRIAARLMAEEREVKDAADRV